MTTVAFWSNLFGRGAGVPAATLPSTPFSSNDLVQITVKQLWDNAAPALPSQSVAQRVPGLKRAASIHAGIVARLPLHQYVYDERIDPQPRWLTNSASGVSPYHRTMGVVQDLFWWGWACLGAEVKAGEIVDAIHIPFGMWSLDPTTGQVQLANGHVIPSQYTDRFIAIPLGVNGVMIDGLDTIQAARDLEAVWMDRVKNPIAQTELHLTEDLGLTRAEKRKLARDYNEGRQLEGGATSVSDHNVEVKIHGQVATDLFESGRNAVRLDLANHAFVPASIIEGAKNGSAGEINYSNETGKRNELYDFGTSLFVNAIEARLSMDDVCPPGESIRADLTDFMSVPTPTTSLPQED